MDKVIFHIDVNSAFLSWEAVYRLKEQEGTVDLREIPCAVGGDKTKRRGVILAKSLSAKAYGVRTGELLPMHCVNVLDLPLFRLIMECTRNIQRNL